MKRSTLSVISWDSLRSVSSLSRGLGQSDRLVRVHAQGVLPRDTPRGHEPSTTLAHQLACRITSQILISPKRSAAVVSLISFRVSHYQCLLSVSLRPSIIQLFLFPVDCLLLVNKLFFDMMSPRSIQINYCSTMAAAPEPIQHRRRSHSQYDDNALDPRG